MNTKAIPALTPISRMSLKTIADSKYVKTTNFNDVENKPNLDKNNLVLGDTNYNSMNFHEKNIVKNSKMGITNDINLDISTKNEPVIDLIENNDFIDNNNLDISVISSDGETKDQDLIAVPDSTTQVIKTVQQFNIGEDVFVQQKDKRYFLGTITSIDPRNERCLVKFGDNTESWSDSSDLVRPDVSSRGPMCIVCKSTKSNKDSDRIVVCDKCERGYHQKCHTPRVLNPDAVWNCRRCVDQLVHMRKLENKTQMRRNSNTIEMATNPVMSVTTTTAQNQFPYDLSSLVWDEYHRSNRQRRYCYCGGDGDWRRQMVQCARCRQWFHQRCVQALRYPVYDGDRFYVFVCSLCNYGSEFVRRLEMKWVDIVHLLLYNLSCHNQQIKYYDLDDVLIPYANDNWHALQLPPQIKDIGPQDLRREILATLTQNQDRFRCGREIKKRVSIWGLRGGRQPPPAPCVTVGFNGVVTDGMLREAWRGNRRLQFLNPVSIVRPQNSIARSNSYPGADFLNHQTTTKLPQSNTIREKDNMIVPLDSTMLEKMRGQLLNENQDHETDSDSIFSIESNNSDTHNFYIEQNNESKIVENDEPNLIDEKKDLKLVLKIDVSREMDNVMGSRKRKNVRKVNKMKEICPPTPPTSVSAPPTPPASNNLGCLSNDMSYNLGPDYESKDIVKTVYDSLKNEFKNDLCDSSDETSSRCTLDSIIPPPKDFQGKNNPFHSMPPGEEAKKGGGGGGKAGVGGGKKSKKGEEKVSGGRGVKRKVEERDFEKDDVGGGDGKRRKFGKSVSHSKTRNSLPEMSTAVSKTASYTPLRSSIGGVSETKHWPQQRSLRSSLTTSTVCTQSKSTIIPDNTTIISNCVNYALNGRRLRQRQDITYAENGRRNKNGSNLPVLNGNTTGNNGGISGTSGIGTNTGKVGDVCCITDLKSSVNMYFGGMNRILSGEKFAVQGRRVNAEGRVQYLIEWEGASS